MGASEWLAGLPDGQTKQNAVQTLVNNLSYQYPDIAAPWAESMPDGPQRNNTIQNIARNWLRTDPTAARKWLQGISLPAEIKARLLSGN